MLVSRQLCIGYSKTVQNAFLLSSVYSTKILGVQPSLPCPTPL